MAPSQSSIPQIDKGSLKRVLGITDLFSIGYGDLGSSIFYALGITAMFALGATPLALMAAGVVFVCTALSYAELTAIYHETGGSASFSRHAFNDLISFVAGWGLLLDYIVTIAISAFTIGPYLAQYFSFLQGPEGKIIFAIIVIWALFLMNFFGVKQSTRISFVLMAFTLLVQLLLIAVALFAAPDFSRVFEQLKVGVQGAPWSPTWDEFIRGIAMAMVAYTGIESIAQLSSETRRPIRTVPRAIILTMIVLLLMYFGLSIVSLALLTPHELGVEFTQHPLEGMAAKLPFGGDFFVPLVSIIAAVVLFVASNAGLIGASRLSFNMGEYYQLPRFFYAIHPKYRTPHVSLALFAVAASVIIALSRGRLAILADLYNFGAQIAFFSTHMALIVLRIKKPKMRRPFKVPINIKVRGYEIPIPAIVGALATFSVWLLVVFEKPDGRYLGMGWLILGLTMYFAYRKQKKISPTGQITLHKIKMPQFKELKIASILLPVRSGTQTETVQVACELAKLHRAKITAVSVIEVPFSLPLETPLPDRVAAAGRVVKTVEALAIDTGVEIELKIVRARNISEAILNLVQIENFDLVIIGAMRSSGKAQLGVGPITEQILHEAPCRVWVCGSDYSSGDEQGDVLVPASQS